MALSTSSLPIRSVIKPISNKRRFIGAKSSSEGTIFRVWAPNAKQVDVIVEGKRAPSPLVPESDGYFSAIHSDVRPGDRYKFSLDGGEPYPDPASRYQPDGPHGPSQVIDST